MSEEIVGWDEALSSSGYVKLETDTTKILTIKNWKLVRTEKFGDEVVELQAEVTHEDDKAVEKTFTVSSNRLKKKLKDILEPLDPSKGCKLSILKVGDKFDTQYSVKKLE